ncbi:protein translocase subunit SecF [Cognatiluteimonas weifangensis]|uniref:Protein-export membrane protein SecF n=1 Tax=Cognatiluteimonas weifangensis TaxID=2303539 RepID=A0A372DSQ6_9GAMM|nr:protein translocase subunit SecF [Luteimonas weifangensis]RFP62322.1 protein translocase subunit SecF [Luteimonas weifangensis]
MKLSNLFPLSVFPHDSKFDFMRLRWASATLSVILLVIAIGAMATKGFNFALDFTGGIVTELRFDKPADVDGVRQRLEQVGYPGAQVQTFGSGNDLLVRLQPKDLAEGQTSHAADEVLKAASTAENPAHVLRSDSVGPQIGKELAQNGIYAMLFVIVGFLAYISFRFEWKFAVAAILATMHDIVVVAGWFAVTGHEFDLTVLAGVMSVMGYSINDTIVVFDRVRENFRGMRAPAREILNAGINQTLSRTVITSFVAFLTVLALYMYGGGSLQGMAESQMIGIVVGTLSSIFVACPLLMWLGVSKQDLMPKAKDEAALARRP